VLVTLGGLSADLSLGLYDSSCHLIASSVHGGKRYEEIYRSLSTGTYYARVTGVSGAVSPFDVRFRVLLNAMTVVSSRVTVSGGSALIIGEVLNNTNAPIESVEVGAILYDASGRVVTTTTAITDTEYVGAWQRAPFGILAAVPPTYAKYRLFVETPVYADNGTSTNHLSLTVHSPAVVAPDGRDYPFTVKNTNTFTISRPVVAAVIRNSFGNVLYENAIYVERNLAPAASLTSDLLMPDVSGENAIAFYVSADRKS